MPTLEAATRIVRYARKDHQPGDRFEASDKDAKILVAIGKAKYSDTPAKSPSDLPDDVMSRASKRQPVTEDEVEEREVQDVDPKSAQTYRHRAMVAEDPKAKPLTPVEPIRHQPAPGRSPGKPKGSGPGRSGKGKI